MEKYKQTLANIKKQLSSLKLNAKELDNDDELSMTFTKLEGTVRELKEYDYPALDDRKRKSIADMKSKIDIMQDFLKKKKAGPRESKEALVKLQKILKETEKALSFSEVIRRHKDFQSEYVEQRLKLGVLVVEPWEQLSAREWYRLAHWARINNRLTNFDRRFAFSMGVYINRGWELSDSQRNQAERIYAEAKSLGFGK